ncbi:pirin family protein [Paenibacillus sp. GCM10023252]|uniref:pirin family protein n=1 Tax=Paenibacillus sp. GCM10023252 TaxID=3252649 RepID=UPI00362028F0
MHPRIYHPELQAKGSFDDGKITEQKPIGFSGEGSVVKRVGPLFYWAWAFCADEGYIPEHPHFGFEIITYVVQGQVQHGDSLGTRSAIGAGGIQVMQTGSGVSHEERFLGPDMEAFQIWFEPNMEQSVKSAPTYYQYEHEQLSLAVESYGTMKTVIGEGSPVRLEADVLMWDVEIKPGHRYSYTIPQGRDAAALAIRGEGSWAHADDEEKQHAFHAKDFTLISELHETTVLVEATGVEPLRMIVIEVPSKVDYPLYPKR